VLLRRNTYITLAVALAVAAPIVPAFTCGAANLAAVVAPFFTAAFAVAALVIHRRSSYDGELLLVPFDLELLLGGILLYIGVFVVSELTVVAVAAAHCLPE
jgi:hypothetical protein